MIADAVYELLTSSLGLQYRVSLENSNGRRVTVSDHYQFPHGIMVIDFNLMTNDAQIYESIGDWMVGRVSLTLHIADPEFTIKLLETVHKTVNRTVSPTDLP